MDFRGAFETHITFERTSSIAPQSLNAHFQKIGGKLVLIELARGLHPTQPMLTVRSRGTLADALAQAHQALPLLDQLSLHPTRIKIEAGIDNQDVPQSDADAQGAASAHYFEHHLKLQLVNPTQLVMEALASLAQRHNAHLSRNALTLHPDGVQERFITQRCHRLGRASASLALKNLLQELNDINLLPVDIEQEYVVYDTNLSLDDGWLASSGASS